MPARRLRAVLHVAHRAPAPDPATLPDSHLLGRFLDHRDEAAFAAVVRRHGPVVYAACRLAGLTPSDHDDVFQATFLALVRQAASVRDGKSLGGWLFRVATRVARKVKLRNVRTVELPESLAGRPSPSPDADTQRVLDEEITKLPEKYRLVVTLVYLCGRTTTETAADLGWAKGTVLTRLAWARDRLRGQLLRRGVTLAVGAAAVVTPPLTAGVVRVCSQALAGGVPAGVSGVVVELSKGVVQDMALSKLKWAAVALLAAVAVTGVGLGRWAAGEVNARPDDNKSAVKKKDKKAKPPAGEPAGILSPPAPTPLQREEPAPVRGPLPQMDVLVVDTPPESKAKPVGGFTVSRPVGTWAREVVQGELTTRLTLKFDNDRLKGTAELTDGKQKYSVALDADYAINGESTVFGVLSGIDAGELPDGIDESAHALVGQPFAFRYRISDGYLTVKEFKGLGVGLGPQVDPDIRKMTSTLCGRYVEIDPAKPNARPVPRTVVKPGGGPSSDSNPIPPPTVAPNSSSPPVGESLLPPQPTQRRSGNDRPDDLMPRTDRLDNTPDELRPRTRGEKSDSNGRSSHLTPERIHGGIMKAEPPTDGEVLAAFNKRRVTNQAGDEEFQDDIQVVKNLIVDNTHAPQFFPFVGLAQLHRYTWECSVYWRDAAKKPKVELVSIDQHQLVPYVGEK